MRTLTLAATQMTCGWDWEANLSKAESLVRNAAQQGAQVILIQELFEGPYFCKDQKPEYFERAYPLANHPAVQRFQSLAKELSVVLPVSVFERSGTVYFNTVAVVDADGVVLGHYRKSHIPDGPGYQEKFYFSPGDTGFRVWNTQHGRIGVGICWDQWFPEAARALVLQGAEVLLYPTAIGSEPPNPDWDSQPHWTRVMQGHAAANIVPLVASNRIGTEKGDSCSLTFYGSSFIAGPLGELRQQAGSREEAVLVETFDLDEIQTMRQGWGLFRDRRPDLYGSLLSLDGSD